MCTCLFTLLSTPNKMTVVTHERRRNLKSANQMPTVCDVIRYYVIGYDVMKCQIKVHVTAPDKMAAMKQPDGMSLKNADVTEKMLTSTACRIFSVTWQNGGFG